MTTERAEVPSGPRERLARALVRDPGVSREELAGLARSACWNLPGTMQAVAVSADREVRPPCQDESVLADWGSRQPYLLIGDPGQREREALLGALRGRTVVVGPVMPLAEVGSSLRWARRLLALLPAHTGPETRIVRAEDHLSTLLLLQDETLTRLLVSRRLRPLADLTPLQSERLAHTLLIWLEGGGAAQTARKLGLHPQTVRYRMRQAEKLFGSDLRDPRSRFELELALHSLRLATEVRRARADVPPRRSRADHPPRHPRTARLNGL
jgi:DNA-binding CsgD family transcriptional regulator